jgi:hypothetical protein
MDVCWDSDDDAEYEMVMMKDEGANKKTLYEEEDEDMTEDGKAN